MTYHAQMLEIVRRREQLTAQCAAQRAGVVALLDQLQGPLKIADHALDGIEFLRKRPAVLVVLAAVLTVVQRRGLWGWVRRGVMLWRGYRALSKSNFTFGV
jgi:hypothetical protein